MFLQVNQHPAAQTLAGSVVQEMVPNCLQWVVSVQTQIVRYELKTESVNKVYKELVYQ